jgi:hypothetical protein
MYALFACGFGFFSALSVEYYLHVLVLEDLHSLVDVS